MFRFPAVKSPLCLTKSWHWSVGLLSKKKNQKKRRSLEERKEYGSFPYPKDVGFWCLFLLSCAALYLQRSQNRCLDYQGVTQQILDTTLLEPKLVWQTLIWDESLFTSPSHSQLASHMEAPGTHPIRWPKTSARWQVRCNPTREIRWKMLKMSGGKYWTSDPLQH